MDIKIRKSGLTGTISVPGSKSHSIRAAVCGMLGDGISLIHSPLDSADTRSCLGAALKYGAQVAITPELWTITGHDRKLRKPKGVVDLGNSGTSLCLLAGMAAAMEFPSVFDGDESLRSRPMAIQLDALAALGAKVESNDGKCPISIQGPLTGGKVEIVGTSSQYLSGLLFAAPLAQGDTEIFVRDLNEKPYVEITLHWLQRLGIKFKVNDAFDHFKVKGNQKYPCFECVIPADFSTAAFPLLAAAVTGAELDIRNLDFDDPQGDKAVFEFFRRMGMSVETKESSTLVKNNGPLTGGDFDLNATPDALPAMAAAAAYCRGTTRLLNVPQARIKETDRIACMRQELAKMGANITELPDGLVIEGGPLTGTVVDGHGDHRIVMALAVAALGAEGETIVTGAEAAAVTYPGFIRDFRKLGAQIEVIK